MTQTAVVVVGAGPVGLVAALKLARRGVDVAVLEAEPSLPLNLRASTFHPPTLDMLDELGVVEGLMAQGLKAPKVQYRDREVGLLAEFDFAAIADLTNHPYRVQCEQYKLNQLLLHALSQHDCAQVRFGARVDTIEQSERQITAIGELDGEPDPISARYLIGADGAASAVRRGLDIGFEGFTWPDRFLVASTDFDFTEPFPDLTLVNYVADPEEWCFLLKVPELWRVMFPTRPEESDESVLQDGSVQARLKRVFDPGHDLAVAHKTLYRVHQRVAARYRDRLGFVAGDAAHINNPLGGMGMNGGIHDAWNLAEKLGRVLRDGAGDELLDSYEAERRPVALRYINEVTIKNKRNLETADPTEQAEFRAALRSAAATVEGRRAFLRQVSMLSSLGR